MEHGTPITAGQDPLIGEMCREAFRKIIPLSVTVELTLQCNLRCVHCYNFDRDKPLPVSKDQLAFEDWQRVFRELREAGTLFLNLTGGEAMAHPRFWDLLDEAAANRFAVTILTNGTFLAPQITKRLAAHPAVTAVSISLYGTTEDTHRAITQGTIPLSRVMEGVERLRDLDVCVHLKWILMKGNAHETEAFIEKAEQLGVPYNIDSTITGRYDGEKNSLATRVEIDTLEKLYRGPLRSHLVKRELKSEPAADEFRCNCARGNAAIFSNGDVTSCIAVPLPAGNVLRQSFGEIWKSSPVFQQIRNYKPGDYTDCAPCEIRAWCRRSPGPPTVLHGEYTGIDPWVCEEAGTLRKIMEDPNGS